MPLAPDGFAFATAPTKARMFCTKASCVKESLLLLIRRSGGPEFVAPSVQ